MLLVPSKQSEFPGISEDGTLRLEEIALNTLLGLRLPSEIREEVEQPEPQSLRHNNGCPFH
jgi:hypothetical protein